MKRNKDMVILILLVFITVWLTAGQIITASFVRNQYSAVSIRFKTGGITERDLKEALDKEKEKKSPSLPEATAWIRIPEAEVKNTCLGRKQKISVIVVKGDMAAAAPMALISGNFVYPGDKQGCVLDSKTAYALFGTEYAVSNTVTYEKKNYILRGIIKTDYPVFLIQGDKDRMEYSSLELTFAKKERGEVLAQEFLLLNSPGTDCMVIDGYFYGRLIHSFLTLPVWVFSIFWTLWLGKYFIHKKGSLPKKTFLLYGICFVITAAAYGLLLYQFTGNPVYIPEKLIPTKWSDFNYWSEQYREVKNQLLQLRYAIPNPKDIYLTDEISKLYLRVIVITILHMSVFLHVRLLISKRSL